MNILFNTGHPAQIHNFKNSKLELEKKGHKVFWLASDKEMSKYLLDYYGIEYTLVPRPEKSIVSKFTTLIRNTIFTWKYIRKEQIDISISRVSPHISLACFFNKTKHFAMTDTETAGFYDKFFGQFATSLFTATSFKRKLRKDQIRFRGNIELFYLHPKRFNPKPRKDVERLLGINNREEYIIMRYVSWEAYHDKGLSGFSNENKVKAVEKFSKFAKVFISAEKELPGELESYRIKIQPQHMHDVLAYATLFFGESSTMASESAVLGTTSIYLNENWLGYTNEEAKYGLLHPYRESKQDQIESINKGVLLLSDPELNEKTQKNRIKFLKDKIDPTAFLVWFIENYPQSATIMKENPDYQYNFR